MSEREALLHFDFYILTFTFKIRFLFYHESKKRDKFPRRAFSILLCSVMPFSNGNLGVV